MWTAAPSRLGVGCVARPPGPFPGPGLLGLRGPVALVCAVPVWRPPQLSSCGCLAAPVQCARRCFPVAVAGGTEWPCVCGPSCAWRRRRRRAVPRSDVTCACQAAGVPAVGQRGTGPCQILSRLLRLISSACRLVAVPAADSARGRPSAWLGRPRPGGRGRGAACGPAVAAAAGNPCRAKTRPRSPAARPPWPQAAASCVPMPVHSGCGPLSFTMCCCVRHGVCCHRRSSLPRARRVGAASLAVRPWRRRAVVSGQYSLFPVAPVIRAVSRVWFPRLPRAGMGPRVSRPPWSVLVGEVTAWHGQCMPGSSSVAWSPRAP